MASTRDAVLEALDRWVAGGLVQPDQAQVLRTEVEAATERERTRWSQFVLAGTGAVVLLTAAGVFLGWAWPAMEAPARVAVLLAVGAGLMVAGVRLERWDRWVPPAYLMQTAGLSIVFVAVGYSAEAWPDGSAGAVVLGVVGLAVTVGSGLWAVRRNAFMPAVHLALGYGFLGLFLSRALAMDGDTILWVLDGALVLSIVALLVRIRAIPGGGGGAWALNAFTASLYAGFVLVWLTALGPLDMDRDSVYALDVWWAVVTGFTLWSVHRAPPALRRGWDPLQLGLSVGLGIPLWFYTLDQATGASTPLTAAAMGAYGAAWLAYGLPRRAGPVVIMACAALVAAAWYLGLAEAGALGAVLALAFTGALLFWVSGRVGRVVETPNG